MYRDQAHRLAAETLFIGKPTLEDAQAMTLLAAYSERTWLAISHATQIALLLNLQEAVPILLQNSTNSTGDRRTHRNLWVSARTWLAILCIEWEIAAGTARRPRLEKISIETLRQYALLPAANPSDFRIVSSVEMVMLRCKWPELDLIADMKLILSRRNSAKYRGKWESIEYQYGQSSRHK